MWRLRFSISKNMFNSLLLKWCRRHAYLRQIVSHGTSRNKYYSYACCKRSSFVAAGVLGCCCCVCLVKRNDFAQKTSKSWFCQFPSYNSYSLNFHPATAAYSSKNISSLLPFLRSFYVSIWNRCPTISEKLVRCYVAPSGGKGFHLVTLGSVNDFQEGRLYQISVNDGKNEVLICKTDGKWHCTGAFCSHYEAPLSGGALTKDRIICPLHAAEFDITTGMPTGPALNPIPVYSIKEENGQVLALLPKEINNIAEPLMVKRDPNNSEVYLIIGGGAAAIGAVESLRQNGFTGNIIMVTKESYLPYDRIVLSKNLSASMNKIQLRNKDFYNEYGIDVRINSEVVNLNTEFNYAELKNGEKIHYMKALIATGAKPRTLDVPGKDLKNIFVLRTFDDAQKIRDFAKRGLRIVIVGSSFIGMEVASCLAKSQATVTIISNESVPFEKSLGVKVGDVFKRILKENNIKFYSDKRIKSFVGNSGEVVGVEINNGDIIQCDAVVLGVGSTLNTGFMKKSLINNEDGSICVDPFMKIIGTDNVFAAGDIAKYPYTKTGANIRIEHWVTAINQGRIAGANMCSKYQPYVYVPFFWSMVAGNSIRYTGYCDSYDDVICEGDLTKNKFVAYYTKGNKILAVASMNKDPICVAANELMKLNRMPSPSEIVLGISNSETILENLRKSTIRQAGSD